MPNRLAQSHSLYLRQHADNPVDWHPWGPEALALAKQLDKPLLVSIGYSACHWCHVMAHECFEDAYIASLMNEHFVCIKVDREERPDLDQLYMDAVQMITGRGGWPLNAFCLPDGRPFFGGTYFPSRDRGQGIIPWPQLLMRVAEHFKQDRTGLEENAQSICSNIAFNNNPPEVKDTWAPQHLLEAASALASTHDDDCGGFGAAPKFPAPMIVEYLLRILRSPQLLNANPSLGERIPSVVSKTLEAMAYGGLHDHVGGGFMRYCVDREWQIPHFEKMLYDNALLLKVYAQAYAQDQDPMWKATAEGVIEWLHREMRVASGAYAATLDADSEGHEGSYYVWKPTELDSLLGAESGAFQTYYGITSEGNFEHGNSHLYTTGKRSYEAWAHFNEARQTLLEARKKRPAPGRDDKVLLGWNSLVVTSLLAASRAFNRPDWLQESATLLETLLGAFKRPDGLLAHVQYAGKPAEGLGTLCDHVYCIEACLALAEQVDLLGAAQSAYWVQTAEGLTTQVLSSFGDPQAAGYFYTAHEHEALAVRKKLWYDSAMPAGNGLLLGVLSKLYALTAKAPFLEAFESQRSAYIPWVTRAPNAVASALCGLLSDYSGVATVTAYNVPLEPLWNAQHPAFLVQGAGVSQSGYALCAKGQCYPLESSAQAVMQQLSVL
ncbi:MAG: hypothetical protein B7X06_00015 [Verrucomicrobia bacterium 21-51-4]|nr:MAG: hypothetical protein B7X06_00015 [Verrucomicrobia bacterium 21-51-4]HQU08339.1 thioredoxin domain-containing protein [Opitutales bacterium]